MRKLYLLVFTLLFYVTSFAQSVSIGAGTVTNATSPWDSYYGYSYVQTLYLASEINASGNITSITFDYAGPSLGNSDSITIFMGNTSKSLFSSTTDWIPVSSITEVYKDILPAASLPGPVTITLTTPFPYNGTSNLIIAVDENKPNYDGAVRFNGTLLTGSNRVIYNRSDVTNPNPFAPPTGVLSSTIGNIIIDGLVGASCQGVTGVSMSNITATTATGSWTAPAGGNAPAGYDWEVRTSGFPGSGATGLVVSGNSTTTDANITGLISATNDTFYVRSVCGAGSFGPWSSGVGFSTLCGPTNVPYSVNFEGSTSSFPICTGVENVGTGNIWNILNNPGYGFTSNTLSYTYNFTTPADTWFYTQGLNLTAGVSYRLSFRYGNNSTGVGGYVESLEVKYGSSPAAASMSDLVVDYPSISIAASANSVTDFTPSSTGVYYFGFHAYSIANQDELYVDDISVTVSPTCDVPTAIIQSNITTNGIQLDWTAPTLGTPTAYDLYYSTNNTAPVGTTTPTVAGINGTTKNITGLVAATKYYFYLRTVCGTSGKSGWTAVDSFTTLCNAVNSLNENFDGVSAPSLPTCWSKILRGSTLGTTANVYTLTTAGNVFSSPNAVALYSSSSTSTDDIILVSPRLSNVGAGTYQLTFFAKNSTATQDIEVGTLDNNTSTAMFSPLQSVDISTTFQKYTVSFSAYSGTDQYIGIRVINASSFSYAYIDNFVWELVPTCVEPNAIVASNITSNSAQIDWTAPSSSSPASYDVYYSSTNTAPTGSTTPSIVGVSGTTANLTSLISSTNYYVWVRSNCGTGGLSSWSPSYTFATACGVVTAPTAAPQTFVTAISPPLCWSRAQGLLTTPVTFSSTTTSNWVIDDYLNVTSPINKCIKLNIYGTTRKEWLMTPSYDLGTGGNLQMEFDIALTNWNGTSATTLGTDDKAVVLISIDNGVSWDPVNALRTWDATTTISNTGEHIIIPLSPYSGTVMFAFYGESTVSNADNDLFIDNFEIKTQTIFPVQLMSFAGYKKDGLNQLSWNTASEQGNKGFEIERSIDGIHFTSVGFASSKAFNGNSNGILEYKFTDERTLSATTHYRLRQVNLDGHSKYSNIITIKGIKVAEVVLSSIFPNPVMRDLSVIISSPEKENLTIVITDLAGKTLLRKSILVDMGENKVNMNVEALNSGTYIIKSICQNGCESAVQKFVKQ